MNKWNLLSLVLISVLLIASRAYADSVPAKLTYGSDFEGGKVACMMADGGLANLITTKADNADGIGWGGLGKAIGPSAQSNTNDAANTEAIVKQLGTSEKYAALLCSNYEIDAAGNTPCQAGNACYNDWYLPAKDELECLFKHRKEIGGFAPDFYWSSTEFAGYPAFSAWDKYFGDDPEHPLSGEDDFERVRCVRLFNS